MNKKIQLLLPLCLLLLSGCAQMVTKTYSPSRGGVVKYNTGWFMADTNRSKAVEEMRAYCSPGRPAILQENSKLESTGRVHTSGSNSGSTFSSTSTESKESNIYIHFKCVKSNKTARR